ncbi:MAG TPA: LppX_LprAFG lipoprotein, partial [Pseudonocardiaceae bacterium]
MRSRHLRLLALLAALLVGLLTACGASPQQKKPPVPTLPAGAALLSKSAKAMSTVKTTKFSINVLGEVKAIPFKDAKGQLTKDGLAKGTATVEFGQVVEVEF